MKNFFVEPVNLMMWPMFDKISGEGHIECFLATNSMKKGDILFLHVGSQVPNYKSGIYAVGEIISDPYILHDSPKDYCNEKNTVDVKIIKINFKEPYVSHDECKKYINQFRTWHKLVYENGLNLYNKIFDSNFDEISYSYDSQKIEEHKDLNLENDYNIQFVDFYYLKDNDNKKRSKFRSTETDYEAINKNKKDIGNKGENIILNYEKTFLSKNGRDDLACKVEMVKNDAMGYDIISYDLDGNEKHIEVKTNNNQNNKSLDFYFTDNEYETMINDPAYNIYYLYDISVNPKVHIINKEILKNEKGIYMRPILYKVSIGVEEK